MFLFRSLTFVLGSYHLTRHIEVIFLLAVCEVPSFPLQVLMRGAFVRPCVCVCVCVRVCAAEEGAGRREGEPFGICLEGGLPPAWTWSKNSHSSAPSAFGKRLNSEVIDSDVYPGWGIVSSLDFTSLWPEALPAPPAVCVCLSGPFLSWRQPGPLTMGP